MPLSRRVALLGASFAAFVLRPAAAKPRVADEFTFIHTYTLPGDRSVSVRVSAPRSGKRWGVIAFSHGANARSSDYEEILQPWRHAGWLVLAPDHLDAGGPPDKAQVSAQQLAASRVADIRAILDQRDVADAIAGRFGSAINWDALVVAGHSYGGITAQSVAGARTVVRDGPDALIQPSKPSSPFHRLGLWRTSFPPTHGPA